MNPGGPERVRLVMVMFVAKAIGVVGKIPTALLPEFVIMTELFVVGGPPSDHVKSSQCPLTELVQLFVCAHTTSPPETTTAATIAINPIFICATSKMAAKLAAAIRLLQ